MNDDQITPPAADPADAPQPARRRAAPRAASRRKRSDAAETTEAPVESAAAEATPTPPTDAAPETAEPTPPARGRASAKAKAPRAPSRRAPRAARPAATDAADGTNEAAERPSPPPLPAMPQAELLLEAPAERPEPRSESRPDSSAEPTESAPPESAADGAVPGVEPAPAAPDAEALPVADVPVADASGAATEGDALDEPTGPRRKRKRRRGRSGSDADGELPAIEGDAPDLPVADEVAAVPADSPVAEPEAAPAEPLPLTVVSLGLEVPPVLSAAARAALSGARVILGTAEALDRLGGLTLTAPQHLCGAETAHLDVRSAGHAGAVLVCVGDAAGDGPAAELLADLGPAHVRVLPGVGRVQAACAALGLSAEIISLVDLRRAPLAALRGQLRAHRLLAVPVADAARPAAIARLLLESGFTGARVWVCEFTGDAPRATAWLATELVDLREPIDPHAVLIVATGPSAGVFPELPGLSAAALGDEADAALPLAVRVLALAWLQPGAWETGWALSDGEASLALEWARAVPTARVRAVGVDPTLLGLSLARAGVGENLAAIPSAMPSHAAAWPVPDAVFIRGGAALPDWLAAAWARLAPGGRLVVSAEDDQARADLVAFATQVPAEAWQELALSRGESVAGRLRFVPDAPVRLALWRKPVA